MHSNQVKNFYLNRCKKKILIIYNLAKSITRSFCVESVFAIEALTTDYSNDNKINGLSRKGKYWAKHKKSAFLRVIIYYFS